MGKNKSARFRRRRRFARLHLHDDAKARDLYRKALQGASKGEQLEKFRMEIGGAPGIVQAARALDESVELFIPNVPNAATPLQVVQTLQKAFLRREHGVNSSAWSPVNLAAEKPILRCIVRPNRRKLHGFSSAIVIMRNRKYANCLLNSVGVVLSDVELSIRESARPRGGSGAAWQFKLDPGATRVPIGLVEVGEILETPSRTEAAGDAGKPRPTVGDKEFRRFWSSTPVFDLMCNSHVEVNPVSRHIAITLGRPIGMLQSTEVESGSVAREFVMAPSMLRLEVPFQSLRSNVTVESSRKAPSCYAISFPIGHAPFLYRKREAGTSGIVFWDVTSGLVNDIEWDRTVDFTESKAFARASVLRVYVPSSQEKNELTDAFVQLKMVDASTLHQAAEVSRMRETNVPSSSVLQYGAIARKLGVPFAIRYAVECLIAAKTLSLDSVCEAFWMMLLSVPERDALEIIESVRVAAESANSMIFDPLMFMREYLSDTAGSASESSDTDDSSLGEDAISRRIGRMSLRATLARRRAHVSENGFSRPVGQSGGELAWIRRVHVTPTRVIPMRPELDLTNRVLRRFAPWKDNFCRITFVDEDGGSIAFVGTSDLYTRIHNLLKYGIEVAGETFQFLAFSNSQLRDHNCWGYCASDLVSVPNAPSANDIRLWMGDFSRIRVPSKYAARQGQAFSSTVGTVSLKNVDYAHVDDVHDTSFVYCFSDGVGTMTSKLGRQVASELRISRKLLLPSAYQVRFGGAKGMLTVWDEHVAEGYQLMLRQSMVKFNCEHTDVEVVGYSKRLAAYLNKQIIVILSGLGVPDISFVELQKKALRALDEAMGPNGGEAALDLLYTSGAGSGDTRLKSASPMMDVVQMLRCGLSATNCEHVFNVLLAYRKRVLSDLAHRARIPVEKGVCLVGVMGTCELFRGVVFPFQYDCHADRHVSSQAHKRIRVQLDGVSNSQFFTYHVFVCKRFSCRFVCTDEANVLNHGEIYFQFTDPRTGLSRGFLGDVVVGRSPCLHPGDIRRVKSVSRPGLEHLVNVIVFPQRGERPVPSMLSGGDLDGDIFFVLWDDTLLPSRIQAPMDYSAPNPKELDRNVQTSDVIEFFVEYIQNDRLGQIASAHQVQADIKGIFSTECLRLAELHSKAVDFAKTGQPVSSLELLPFRHPGPFPDFMGKPEKISYKSRKVLGQLWRSCRGARTYSCSSEERRGERERLTFSEHGSNEDLDLILSLGVENSPYDEEADRLCVEYNYDMVRLMTSLGVKTEGEVCSGMVMNFSSRHLQLRGRREYFTQIQQLNRASSELRNQYRDIFWEGLNQVPGHAGIGSQAIEKACAWYRACAKQAAYDAAKGEVPLLSFPWCVTDVLAKVICMEFDALA